MSGLNHDQERAVRTTSHCMVVAGPGSGKTRVIVAKAEHILRNIPGSRVACVSFTRDSARELRHRLSVQLREARVAAPIVGTFHALAARQLEKAGRLGKLIKPREQEEFVRRALQTSGADIPSDKALEVIEACKASLTFVPDDDAIGALYREYMHLMERNKVVDFFDLMADAVRLMRSGEVAPVPATHLLADEYQDADRVQFAWTMEHLKRGAVCTVVADDDQTIFAWRRALGYNGMQEFARTTSAAKVVLGVNYRSHEEIVVGADRLISQNRDRVEKRFVAYKGRGGNIEIARLPTRSEEANAVISKILGDTTQVLDNPRYRLTVPPQRWAVLARTNRLLRWVCAGLKAAGVRYRINSQDLWGEVPVVFMLGLLRSVQTGDRDAIDHILHWAGVSNATLTRLHQHYRESFACLLHGGAKELPGQIEADEATIISTLMGHGSGWRRNIARGRIEMTIRLVEQWMQGFIKDGDESERLNIAANTLCKLQGTLLDRVDTLSALPRGAGEASQIDKGDGVELLTMHSSKGLEFDNVWIIAAEASIIPNPKSDAEEERRLMYVAMTRARKALYISSCMANPPSSFLAEVGA